MKQIIALSIVLVISIFLFGCMGIPSTTANESQMIGENNIPISNDTNQNPDANQTPSASSGDDLLLLGRSVSQGWADHMGLQWDDNSTMSGTYQGYNMRRYEVESPPGIADSAIIGMETFDSKIVFFKLCFVDFSQDTNDRLVENEQYVQKVYEEAVTKRGKKLIVGNALPQTASTSSDGLRFNHKAYNKWLNDFASTHKDIYVIDLYGMLTDSSGNLRSDYAISDDDSHLNDAAYAKITPELMKLIEKAKSS